MTGGVGPGKSVFNIFAGKTLETHDFKVAQKRNFIKKDSITNNFKRILGTWPDQAHQDQTLGLF